MKKSQYIPSGKSLDNENKETYVDIEKLKTRVDKNDLMFLSSGICSMDDEIYGIYQRIKGINSDIGINFSSIRMSVKKNIYLNLSVLLPANVSVLVVLNPACDSNQLFVYDMTNLSVLNRYNLFTQYQGTYTCYQNTFWSLNAVQAGDGQVNTNLNRLMHAKIAPSEMVFRSVGGNLLDLQSPGGVTNVQSTVGVNMHAINSEKSTTNYLDPNNISVRTMYALTNTTSTVYIPINSTIIYDSSGSGVATFYYIDPTGAQIIDSTISMVSGVSGMFTCRLPIHLIVTNFSALKLYIEPPGEWGACGALLISAAATPGYLSLTINLDCMMMPSERVMRDLPLVSPRTMTTPVSIVRHIMEVSGASVHAADQSEARAFDFLSVAKGVIKAAVSVAKPIIKTLSSVVDAFDSRNERKGYSADYLHLTKSFYRHSNFKVCDVEIRQYPYNFIYVEDEGKFEPGFLEATTMIAVTYLNEYSVYDFQEAIDKVLTEHQLSFNLTTHEDSKIVLANHPRNVVDVSYKTLLIKIESNIIGSLYSVLIDCYKSIDSIISQTGSHGYAMDTKQDPLFYIDHQHNPNIVFSSGSLTAHPLDGSPLYLYNTEYTKSMKLTLKPTMSFSYTTVSMFDMDKSINHGYAMDDTSAKPKQAEMKEVQKARNRTTNKTSIGHYTSVNPIVTFLEKKGYQLNKIDTSIDRASRAIKKSSKGTKGYQFFPVVTMDDKNLVSGAVKAMIMMDTIPGKKNDAYNMVTVQDADKPVRYYFDKTLIDIPSAAELADIFYIIYRDHAVPLYFTQVGFEGVITGRSWYLSLFYLLSDFPDGQLSTGSLNITNNGMDNPPVITINKLGGLEAKIDLARQGLPLIVLSPDDINGSTDGLDFFFNASKRENLTVIRCTEFLTALYVGQLSLRAKSFKPLASVIGSNTSYYLNRLKAVPRNRLLLLGMSNISPSVASGLLFALGVNTTFEKMDNSTLIATSDFIVSKCSAGFGTDVVIGSYLYSIAKMLDFNDYKSLEHSAAAARVREMGIKIGTAIVYPLGLAGPLLAPLTAYNTVKFAGKKIVEKIDTDLTGKYINPSREPEVINLLSKRILSKDVTNLVTKDDYEKTVKALFVKDLAVTTAALPQKIDVKKESVQRNIPKPRLEDKVYNFKTGVSTNEDISKYPDKSFVDNNKVAPEPIQVTEEMARILIDLDKALYNTGNMKNSMWSKLQPSWQNWFYELNPQLQMILAKTENLNFIYDNILTLNEHRQILKENQASAFEEYEEMVDVNPEEYQNYDDYEQTEEEEDEYVDQGGFDEPFIESSKEDIKKLMAKNPLPDKLPARNEMVNTTQVKKPPAKQVVKEENKFGDI